MKYILIEHGDGNPKQLTIFNTVEDRAKATREAILGPSDEDNKNIQCPELLKLATDGVVTFEGDPPLEWIDAEVTGDIPALADTDELEKFKTFVHGYLDQHGIAHGDPENQHQKEGCRIGARLDLLFSKIDKAEKRVKELEADLQDKKIALASERVLLNDLVKRAKETRDGQWIDKWGACRVCGGEIPYGHTDNCEYFKLEKENAELRKAAKELMDWHIESNGCDDEPCSFCSRVKAVLATIDSAAKGAK